MPESTATSNGDSLVQAGARWYAIHTHSNFETKVFNLLCEKSLEAFLPKVWVTSRRKDRRKKILIPLFSGYLFVNIDLTPENHLQIVTTTGVVRLLGYHGKPSPIDPQEIQNLMILNGTDHPIEHQDYLEGRDRVMIMSGPLKGLVGIYQHRKSRSDRVVVSVDFLKRSVSVEVFDWDLQKVS